MNFMNRMLLILTILSLFCMLCVQYALTNTKLKNYLPVYPERGISADFLLPNGEDDLHIPAMAEDVHYGTAKIFLVVDEYTSLPQVKLLVDGVEIASFDKNTLEVEVHDGEALSIDARSCAVPITVRMYASSTNLAEHCLLDKIFLCNETKSLGFVSLK